MFIFHFVLYLLVVMAAFVAMSHQANHNFNRMLVRYYVALSQGRLRPFVEEDDV